LAEENIKYLKALEFKQAFDKIEEIDEDLLEHRKIYGILYKKNKNNELIQATKYFFVMVTDRNIDDFEDDEVIDKNLLPS